MQQVKDFISEHTPHLPLRQVESRATVRSYKPRTDKNRIKEELTVMVLKEDGTSEMYSMTRPDILDLSKEDARRLRTLPFGEMKMKDLRMTDPNVSFGSEPKIIVRTLCALISLHPIHAFIMSNRVLMIVPDGADGILQSVKTSLKSILQTTLDGDISVDDDDLEADEPTDDLVETKPSISAAQSNAPGQQESEPPTASVSGDEQLVSQTDERARTDSEPMATGSAEGGVSEPLLVQRELEVEGEGEAPHMMRSFRSLRVDSQESQKLQIRLEKKTLLRTRSYDSRDETPFQFVALELLFDTAALSFKKEVDYLKLARDEVVSIIRANELLTKVNALRAKIVATRDVVEDFMSDDKDLGLFSFDSIARYYSMMDSPTNHELDAWQPYEMDVNEVEDLAEDFVSRLDDAVNEIDMLRFTIEEVVSNLRHAADERRETLMKLHVRLQGITCIVAIPTLWAGIFGMNLTSGLQTEVDTFNFWMVTAVLTAFFIIATFIFIYFSDRLLAGAGRGGGAADPD